MKKLLCLIAILFLFGCDPEVIIIDDPGTDGGGTGGGGTQTAYGYIDGTCYCNDLGGPIDCTVTAWADRDIDFYGTMTVTAINGEFRMKLDKDARYSLVATRYYEGHKYKGTVTSGVGSSVTIWLWKVGS